MVFLDLTLKFDTQKIARAIGDVNEGEVLTLVLTGKLATRYPMRHLLRDLTCIIIRGSKIPKKGNRYEADLAIATRTRRIDAKLKG